MKGGLLPRQTHAGQAGSSGPNEEHKVQALAPVSQSVE